MRLGLFCAIWLSCFNLVCAQVPTDLLGVWDMWEAGYGPESRRGAAAFVVDSGGIDPVRFTYEFRADSTVILWGDIPFEGKGAYTGKMTAFSRDSVRIKFHEVKIGNHSFPDVAAQFNEEVICISIVDRDHISVRTLWDNESGANDAPQTFVLTRRTPGR